MNIERRNSERREVPENTLFICDQGSTNLTEIKNISAGGLQFIYFPGISCGPECKIIDILGRTATLFYLAAIPCRIVYDINCLSEDRTFSGARTMLSGIEFCGLNQDQLDKLIGLLDTL